MREDQGLTTIITIRSEMTWAGWSMVNGDSGDGFTVTMVLKTKGGKEPCISSLVC